MICLKCGLPLLSTTDCVKFYCASCEKEIKDEMFPQGKPVFKTTPADTPDRFHDLMQNEWKEAMEPDRAPTLAAMVVMTLVGFVAGAAAMAWWIGLHM